MTPVPTSIREDLAAIAANRGIGDAAYSAK
ncbi:hypothetical protein BKA07_002367 [Brevibacterium marinum]|uniref:Uncharacterized protein n=1 Tax=Brevibacterium marinum TaxID=418643 RepID=A0A846S7F9_9MICO|nr:hypothetical protein [Brevibacterium marinum]